MSIRKSVIPSQSTTLLLFPRNNEHNEAKSYSISIVASPLPRESLPPSVAAALHMAFHKYLPQQRVTYLDHVPILWTVWQRPSHAAGARDVARSRSANSRSPQPPISVGKFLVPQSTRSAFSSAKSFFLSPVKTPGSNVALETHPQLISTSSAGYNPGGSKGVHATSDPVRLNNE